jgi:hypothetical protein
MNGGLSHMNVHLSALAVQLKAHRLARAAIVGMALLGATSASALAAPATPARTPLPTLTSLAPAVQPGLPACVTVNGGTTLVTLVPDANGQPALPCTPQPGQQLVIVGGGNTTDTLPTLSNTQPLQNLTPAATATSTPTATGAQPADDHLGTMLDPRVDTYAKRQAIRDKYRGQINETTFNDELGDGVSLDQALADAMAELGKAS